MLWLRLHVFLLLALTADLIRGYGYYRGENIMRKKIDVIYDELEDMEEKLDVLLEEQAPERGDGRQTTWPPIVLLNATRETTGGSDGEFKYTVFFRIPGQEDDVNIMWLEDESSTSLTNTEDLSFPDRNGRILTTSTTYVAEENQLITLTIQQPDSMFSYTLALRPATPGNPLEDYTDKTIHVNTFQVLNEGDVQYDEFRDPVLKVRTHIQVGDKHKHGLISLRLETFETGEENTVACTSRFRSPDELDCANTSSTASCESGSYYGSHCGIVGNKKKYRDGLEYNIKVKTRDIRVSGISTLKMDTDIEKDSERPRSVIRSIKTEQQVLIYPYSQKGPYPEDYIDVQLADLNWTRTHREPYSQDYIDDQLTDLGRIFLCNVDNPVCTFACVAKGDLTRNDFHMTRLGEEGDAEEIDLQHVVAIDRNGGSVYQEGVLTLIPPENITKYDQLTCSSSTRSGAKSEDQITVKYFKPMHFLRNESYAVYNGTSMTIVCKATGRPLPTLDINCLDYRSFEEITLMLSEDEIESDMDTITVSIERKIENFGRARMQESSEEEEPPSKENFCLIFVSRK